MSMKTNSTQPDAASEMPERLYDLAIIRTDTTRRKLTGYPMTHAECCVMKGKFSEEEQSRIIFVPSQSVSDSDHGTQGNPEAALHTEIDYLKEKLAIAVSAQNNAWEANIGLVKQLRESDTAHARLLAENAALVKALAAHNYWWPRRRSAGGGQASSVLSCGHIGPTGAPCCRDCANVYIDAALAQAKGRTK